MIRHRGHVVGDIRCYTVRPTNIQLTAVGIPVRLGRTLSVMENRAVGFYVRSKNGEGQCTTTLQGL